MKNILKIAFLLALTTGCKAQNQTLDISDKGWNMITGAYYKDNQNLLDPFVGTYLYTDGATSLKIILKKKIKSSMNNYYYEDMIIGEYQYIENGVEIVNTLPRLNVDKSDGWKYSISGNSIITKLHGICPDCTPNEKALDLGMADDITHNWAEVFRVRRVIENGQPAIKLFIMWGMTVRRPGEPESEKPLLPSGDYILMKQP